MKKVLYLITKSKWGGAQKYVYDLACRLPRDHFEVAVAAGGDGPLIQKLDRAGIRTIPLPVLQTSIRFWNVSIGWINIRLLGVLLTLFRKERPDIIHLNSSKIGGLGAVAAFIFKLLNVFKRFKLLNVPITIFTVHGWAFKEERPWWQKVTIWFLSWLSSLFQDIIILINTADWRSARRFIRQRKLRLVFNGLEEIDFLPREEARHFLAKITGRAFTSDTILIGTIAEFTKNKGIDYLIDALSGLWETASKFQAILIGDGEEQERLQSRIQKRGLQHIVLLFPLPSDARRYLKGFDIFLLPSLKEGLPYALMEAMAAGLPVVATRVGGIPDLIEDAKNGIMVPARDASALADALCKLVEDKPLRQQFGSLAKETIRRKFRLETMIQETVKSYG